MKRILKQPKIIIYENVEKAGNILLDYFGMGGDMYCEDIPDAVTEILKAFNIPLGKKIEIKVSMGKAHVRGRWRQNKNNIKAELLTDRNGVARIRIL